MINANALQRKFPEEETSSGNDYANYFIRNGQHIGDYEAMYRNCEDPWNHLGQKHETLTDRQIAFNWLSRLKRQYSTTRVVEYGCGLGHLTKIIKDLGFSIVGIDVASSAIERARDKFTDCVFVQGTLGDQSNLNLFSPDAVLMAHVTWCCLDELDMFISNLKAYARMRERPTFLIHLLETYPEGVQKYGVEKFTNMQEILAYFNFEYLEYGTVCHPDLTGKDMATTSTYFVAKI